MVSDRDLTPEQIRELAKKELEQIKAEKAAAAKKAEENAAQSAPPAEGET